MSIFPGSSGRAAGPFRTEAEGMWRAGTAARRGGLGLLACLRRFARAREGVAAVEFALVLPVMLLIYLALSELTGRWDIDRKVAQISRTLADLVARETDISAAGLTTIFQATLRVIEPYQVNDARLRVSSIKVVAAGSGVEGIVCWSKNYQSGTTSEGYAANTRVTVPQGFAVAGTYYIQAEAKRTYTPVVHSVLSSNVPIEEITPWPVRTPPEVKYAGAGCPAT